MKSLSEKRPLIKCTINGLEGIFLVDTGASIGLIDEDADRKYKLKFSRKYPGNLVSASGEIKSSYMCDTPVIAENKTMTLFVGSDISVIQESIKKETGYTILGIIGLVLLKMLGILIRISMAGIDFTI